MEILKYKTLFKREKTIENKDIFSELYLGLFLRVQLEFSFSDSIFVFNIFDIFNINVMISSKIGEKNKYIIDYYSFTFLFLNYTKRIHERDI